MVPPKLKYPLHKRLYEGMKNIEQIFGFVDWLEPKGVDFPKLSTEEQDRLTAEYLKMDMKAFDAETVVMKTTVENRRKKREAK